MRGCISPERTHVPEKTILEVKPEQAGNRLDLFLAHSLGGVSRTAVQEWIRAGAVLVNGKIAKPRYETKAGDLVQTIQPEAEPTSLIAEQIPLQIVYEDESLAVVDKPAGMVVHPGAGVRRGTLANALLYHFSEVSQSGTERPGIVHRLDKDTSGLLVVARNEQVHDYLARQFQRREVDKYYLALVYGRLDQEAGMIEVPLGRDFRVRTRISVRTRKPRAARTEYQVLRRFTAFTYVRVILHTGRTHQIRVHFQYLKHPVVGDGTYGPAAARALVKDAQLASIIDRLGRHFLHATHLAFTHPDGRRLAFDSPLPLELAQLMNRLE